MIKIDRHNIEARKEALKLRIAVWNKSELFANEQAASCRRSACIRSAEYWEADARKAQEYIKMAQHELLQLGG